MQRRASKAVAPVLAVGPKAGRSSHQDVKPMPKGPKGKQSPLVGAVASPSAKATAAAPVAPVVFPMPDHPILQIKASKGITKGEPLKELLNEQTVKLIGQSFAMAAQRLAQQREQGNAAGKKAQSPKFDESKFITLATKDLNTLELTGRSKQIGAALAAALPSDFREAKPLFLAALGPQNAGEGLGSFFYMPHTAFLLQAGEKKEKDTPLVDALEANVALTKVFTSEFCIRALLVRDQKKVLKVMADEWCNDPSVHVRRLVSEGTRPRLPWGVHLDAFKKDPSPCLPLLEKLKWDTELYVRRSVANHVGDILKDNPKVGYNLLGQWVKEAKDKEVLEKQYGRRHPLADGDSDATQQTKKKSAKASGEKQKKLTKEDLKEVQEELFWMVRHAVRNPAKHGEKEALKLRRDAAQVHRQKRNRDD